MHRAIRYDFRAQACVEGQWIIEAFKASIRRWSAPGRCRGPRRAVLSSCYRHAGGPAPPLPPELGEFFASLGGPFGRRARSTSGRRRPRLSRPRPRRRLVRGRGRARLVGWTRPRARLRGRCVSSAAAARRGAPSDASSLTWVRISGATSRRPRRRGRVAVAAGALQCKRRRPVGALWTEAAACYLRRLLARSWTDVAGAATRCGGARAKGLRCRPLPGRCH